MLPRMSVYSMDLRRKVVAADGTLAEVGRRFGVDPRTVRSWRRRQAGGELEPRCGGNPGTLRVLTPGQVEAMARIVDERPGITLRELIEELGLRVAESTVCRRLIKLGFRYKKRLWRRGSGLGPTSPGDACSLASPGGWSNPNASCSSTSRAPAPT